MRALVSLRAHALRACVLALSLLGSACAREHVESADGGAIEAAGDGAVPDLRSAKAVEESLDRDGHAVALVLLAEPPIAAQAAPAPENKLRAERPADARVAERAAAYAELAERVMADVAPRGVTLRVRYQHFPMLLVELGSRAALDALLTHVDVVRVYEDRQVELSLAQSLPLIHQPEAFAAGHSGGGTSVAVLDTGCDYTRAAFGTCSAPGSVGCKVAYAADFAPSDGALDANGHGTNVSAIVLGVAPATKIVALDVFNGSGGSSSDILRAVDFCIQNRTTYNIVAMNLSLGSGLYGSACPNDVFAAGLTNARAAGILPVVASGNNGSRNSVASPACVPAAVAVGAVYDANVGGLSYPGAACSDATTAADQVTCFSNASESLALLAPGARILAADISMSGTSQATPHVAGAVALLRAARPQETLDDAVARLVGTGPLVTDARNGLARHRLDVLAAVGDAQAPDLVGPTGTLSINDGAAATASTAVTLKTVATDASGVASMCVSSGTTCTSFTTYRESSAFTLASGDGTKTVKVWLKDGKGNVATAQDTIVLDTKKPTDGALTASPGNALVDLSWTGFADVGTGLAGYRLVVAENAPPASCAAGSVAYTGTATSFRHASLTNGKTYGYRLCALDGAGGVSSGQTAVARPAPEFAAPTGTVSIAGGADYTREKTATLTLSASDPSGVATMCVATKTTCTSFVAYATSTTVALGKSSGLATVYVWFKDAWGNVSATPASDTIVIDATAPKVSTVTASPGNGKVTLNWGAASDAGSGIASYQLRAAASSAPSSCSEGTLVYSGTGSSATHASLTNGSVYGYLLCATDGAGNVAQGKGVTSRPAPEFDAPSGAISLAAGANFTANPVVTVSLSASDASGTAGMCLSTSASCSNWQTYASTTTFNLAKKAGQATLNVWLRDVWGNTSPTPLSDTITVDTTAPVVAKLTATLSSGAVALSWTDATDAASGLASYKLVYTAGGVPASCSVGTTLYTGTGTTYTHAGPGAGKAGYRLCAIDTLGNVSAGKTAYVTVP